MADVKTERQFWTFVVKSIHLEGSRAFAQGWFVTCTFRKHDDQESFIDTGIGMSCEVQYLTPEAAPITIEVTSILPPKTRLDTLSPKMIVEGLSKIFSLPFETVPDVPLTIPEHRIPPSKRDRARQLLREKQSAGTVGGGHAWKP